MKMKLKVKVPGGGYPHNGSRVRNIPQIKIGEGPDVEVGAETDDNDNYLISPDIDNNSDQTNMMLDMSVAKDKTPFMYANKANVNLQRALTRFLNYHEKERKIVNRMFEQEERYYRNKVATARASTAIPRTRTKVNTIEEEPTEIISPSTRASPRETMELTYTFNSLFGDAQKPMRSPTPFRGDDEDPLAGQSQSPYQTSRTISTSSNSTISPRPFSRSRTLSASEEAFNVLERKRSISGGSPEIRVVKTEPEPDQDYVCENVFGNLSLQVYRDSGPYTNGANIRPQQHGPGHGPSRRPSISENAKKQLQIRTVTSRRPSIATSELYCSSSSTLTYSGSPEREPGLAISKAVNFLEKLDKYAKSRRSKLHEGLVEIAEIAANKNQPLVPRAGGR